MKSTRWYMAVLVMGFAVLLQGCGNSTDVANKKTVKVEISGPSGSVVHGTIRAEVPAQAGLSNANLTINVPGSQEFQMGPSGYEMKLLDWKKSEQTVKVYLDGKELPRGNGLLVDDEKASFMWELKAPEPAKK